MQENTRRLLLIGAIALNVVMLAVILLDFASWNAAYYGYLFVGWAFLLLVTIIIALAGTFRSTAPAPAPAVARGATIVVAEPKPDTKGIPFVYNGYTLYGRDVELKNGGTRPIYFFSKRKPASGHMIAKPEGFHVGVNQRTGLPFLKRGAGKDGENLTPVAEFEYQPQCGALTADGAQCRNSSRIGSKYCASHFGYQPHTAVSIRETVGDSVKSTDTKPRVRKAKDTKPSVRKSTA